MTTAGEGSKHFRSQGNSRPHSQPPPWEIDPFLGCRQVCLRGCTFSISLVYSHQTEEKTEAQSSGFKVRFLTCHVCIL